MKNTLIQINSNGMGTSELALASILIEKYFQLLLEEDVAPKFIVFYNEGVKLLCEDSNCLKFLQELAEKGTKLIGCSTCLNYFKLTEKLAVGTRGSMQDIISLQAKVDKVISL
ncbi:DsrE family protein [Balneicella halophila]|uniref:DsrE family protein n=1 Tax=Balneicella halophila TaxID=1537566 RepID=UPI000E309862|nr:DsrE family protein [Balneicella halophila]